MSISHNTGGAQADTGRFQFMGTNQLFLRDNKGRFQSTALADEKTRQAAGVRKRRMLHNQSIGRKIIQDLLNLVMLDGEGVRSNPPVDWIPSDSSQGPIMRLVETLIKPTYMVKKSEISEHLLTRYFGVSGKGVKDLPTISAYRFNSSQKGITKKVFLGKRLPKVTSPIEMNEFRNWIAEAMELGVLKINKQQSENSGTAIFASYRLVSSTKRLSHYRYTDYPTSAGGSSGSGTSTCSETLIETQTHYGKQNRIRNSIDFSSGSPTSTKISNPRPEQQGDLNNEYTVNVSIPELSNNANNNNNENASDEMRHGGSTVVNPLKYMVSVVKDSTLFFFLCSIVEGESDYRIGTIAAALGTLFQNDNIKTSSLMEDVLEFCKYRFENDEDEDNEQKERRSRISSNVKMLKKVRQILDLPSFEDMNVDGFVERLRNEPA